MKLENDFGLGRLKDSIEFLHINTSKKFKFTDELLELKKLKVLCLNACGPIDNLDFLKNFPNLILHQMWVNFIRLFFFLRKDN